VVSVIVESSGKQMTFITRKGKRNSANSGFFRHIGADKCSILPEIK
jgi:hypothetical protein